MAAMLSIAHIGHAILIYFFYYFITSAVRLVNNVRVSRRSRLPTIIMPFHPINIFVMLTHELYKPIISRLPFGLNRWKYLHFLYRSFLTKTKYAQFAEYGDMLILASSGGRVLYIADADVTTQIVQRRNEFPKELSYYKLLRFYGDSVLTTEGDVWRLHRRVTSPPFGEPVYGTVWKEAVTQVQAMLDVWWTCSEAKKSVDMISDIKSLMRNALSKAGFGVKLPFVSSNAASPARSSPDEQHESDALFSSSVVPEGYTMCYGEALDWLLENLFLYSLIPNLLLRHGPTSWRKTLNAYNDFENYIKHLVERERTQQSTSSAGRKTALSKLVQYADAETKGNRLSEGEVIGNLFILAVAGLETTAGTLQYTILLLALNQNEQDWFYDDLQQALAGESDDPEEWDYAVVYPKLVSCLCIINESLRLFPTFECIVKRTDDRPQAITYRGEQYMIPEDTTVFLCLSALHYNPAYWGDDVNSFRPRNWDARLPDSGWFRTDEDGTRHCIAQGAQAGSAPYCHLRQPLKGTYTPFSEGYRTCIGKNFALVELSVYLAVLFRKYKVLVATKNGETQAEADKRAWDTIERRTTQMTTLALREDIPIRLVKRR